MSQAKRILITGVSKGLGLAMSRGFAQLGYRIAGCSRSEAPSSDWGGEHYTSVDLGDDGAVEAWSREVVSSFGTPDLLINNAAIINRSAPLWEITDPEFSEIVDINIGGVARVIRHFTPSLIKQGSGIIVNFSSGWGRSTSPEVAPYCASKWAIEGLTQALAQELPHGLAAVSFNPGVINTDMLQNCFGDEANHYPDASEWAERAVPFLDQVSNADSGQALTCP